VKAQLRKLANNKETNMPKLIKTISTYFVVQAVFALAIICLSAYNSGAVPVPGEFFSGLISAFGIVALISSPMFAMNEMLKRMVLGS
jgi:hypothetical protein